MAHHIRLNDCRGENEYVLIDENAHHFHRNALPNAALHAPDLLPLFGTKPAQERVVVDRNRIRGDGITAGIDFGLCVAAMLRDARTAQEIQLMMEYDPQPPFHNGSPATADPSLVQQVRAARQHIQSSRLAIAQRVAQQTNIGVE
jgi:cyclohexyl-isocyanide hydratase